MKGQGQCHCEVKPRNLHTKSNFTTYVYPPPTSWGGGYTGITLSVRPSVRPSGFVRSFSRLSFIESFSNFVYFFVIISDCAPVILVMIIWRKNKLQYFFYIFLWDFNFSDFALTSDILILHLNDCASKTDNLIELRTLYNYL